MGWSSPIPLESWDDERIRKLLREMYIRGKFGSFTWNPPNVTANSTVDTVITTSDTMEVSGLRAGQAISVTPPSTIDAGIGWGAFVASDNTLTIRLWNVTGSGINPVSGTWAFCGEVI